MIDSSALCANFLRYLSTITIVLWKVILQVSKFHSINKSLSNEPVERFQRYNESASSKAHNQKLKEKKEIHIEAGRWSKLQRAIFLFVGIGHDVTDPQTRARKLSLGTQKHRNAAAAARMCISRRIG